MNPAAAAVPLSSLDDDLAVAPDPAVWQANLAALAAAAPDLAELLRAARLPASWRPAAGLDGYATWRCEPPGAPPVWLGQTAAPATRAAALLAQVPPGERNVALPALGAGAELTQLLARLPAWQAVYVFEHDPLVLAAVLRLHDFAGAIAAGRAILLTPGREEESLAAVLAGSPGLLPPGNLLLPDLAAPERIHALRRICEQAGRETARARSARLAQLRATPRPAAPRDRPRLAVLALQPRSIDQAVAAGLERAARELGWELLCCRTAGPRHADSLVHCEALHDFGPALTVCVNHLAAALPLPPPGAASAWFLGEGCVPATLPADPPLCLAGSPRIAADLRRAGLPPGALRPCYAACDATLEAPAPAAPGADVLLIADLPDDRPEFCGVELSSHRLLWTHLRQLAERAAAAGPNPAPEDLLDRAEHASGVSLGDPELRAWLTRLIERRILPAAVLAPVARTLAEAAPAAGVLGRGWERLALPGLRVIGPDLLALPDLGAGLRPGACVVAGQRDPLTPALVQAAAWGWPLLLHEPGAGVLERGLGGVLRAGEHFAPFRDTADLRRLLECLRAAPAELRACSARAARHVRASHSYRRRLETLWAEFATSAA